jgi:RNA polymerase sigma-70 factor, ECF subfamily
MNDLNSLAGADQFPEADTDCRLIQAVGKGDSRAFETLIRRYQNPVVNFIYKYLGDRFGAEDLAQEVFLRVYRSAPNFEPRGRAATWIFRIAYNLSMNEIVRRRKFCLVTDIDCEEGNEPPAPSQIEAKELKEELMDSIRRLPEKQRAALLLKVNEDLSYSDIARVLDVSVASVESLLFRARENLRKMLKAHTES